MTARLVDSFLRKRVRIVQPEQSERQEQSMKARLVTFQEAVRHGSHRAVCQIENEYSIRTIDDMSILPENMTWFTDGTGVGYIHTEGDGYSEWTWEEGNTQFYILEE